MLKPNFSKSSKGYTLIEIMFGIVIMLAGMVGVYALLKPASLKAGVEKEQSSLNTLANGIKGGFGRTQGSYAGLTNASVLDLHLDVKTAGTGNNTVLVSNLGDNILVRPAQVRAANDAFDVVYQNLDTKKCVNYIKAFYPQTYNILVGQSAQSVQQTGSSSEGRLVSDDVLTSACAATEFKRQTGTVAFRFFEPVAASATSTVSVCGCTPETQTQDLPCGVGQVGKISQTRSSTCTGGTGACPTAVWTSWTTTSNSCTGAPVAMPGSATPSSPNNSCISGKETQNAPCPIGQDGQITSERQRMCATPTSAPTYTAWGVVKNTCTVASSLTASCTPSTETRNLVCPSGQGGQITEQRSSTCANPQGAPSWGAWVETGRTCSVACVAAGNCCQPLPDQFRNVSCGEGYWGQTQEERNSSCPTITSDVNLNWGAWHQIGGACNACKAPSTLIQIQQDRRTLSCAAGFSGSRIVDYEQSRTQTESYNCPAGTLVEPAPSFSYTEWTDTGNTTVVSDTCSPSSCNVAAGQTFNWNVGGNACTFTAGSASTVTSGSSFTANDTTAPETGTAGFACNSGVLSTTANAGATCSAPAPSSCSTISTDSSTINGGDGVYSFNSSAGSSGCFERDGPAVYNPCLTTIGSLESSTFTAWEKSCTAGETFEIIDSPFGAGGTSWVDERRKTYTCNGSCYVAACTAPAPTSTAITRAVANETQTIGCPAGQTGSITQERTRTENGTRTTSWSCPGPTSTTSDTWSDTYTYGAWATTSNTCVSPSSGACEWVAAERSIWSSGSREWENYTCDPGPTALWCGKKSGEAGCYATRNGKLYWVKGGEQINYDGVYPTRTESFTYGCLPLPGAYMRYAGETWNGAWDYLDEAPSDCDLTDPSSYFSFDVLGSCWPDLNNPTAKPMIVGNSGNEYVDLKWRCGGIDGAYSAPHYNNLDIPYIKDELSIFSCVTKPGDYYEEKIGNGTDWYKKVTINSECM